MTTENEDVESIKTETETEIATGETVVETPKQTMVPHAALHEQREHNKRLQAEVAQLRANSERMEGTFQKLLNGLNEKPAPDVASDPLGHFKHQNEQLAEQIKTVTGKLDGFEQHAQNAVAQQRIIGMIVSSEQEFRTKQPDYDKAVAYLKDVRRNDLTDLGVPVEQIEQILTNEVMGFAQTAMYQGKSPAQVAYAMAKRYGYKLAEAAKGDLATIAKGMEAAKTVGSGGGSTVPRTLAELSQLPEDQLDAFIKDDAKWNAMIRGGKAA